MHPTSYSQATEKLGLHRRSTPNTPGFVNHARPGPQARRNGLPTICISGFVAKKPDDPEAQGLLIAASEFADAVMCQLVRDAAGDPLALEHLSDHYLDIAFGVEVSFVFQELPAEKRNLLVAIMKARNSITALFNGAQRSPAVGEKLALEQLTTDLQREYLELRSQVLNSGIQARLDAVQNKIFNDEFLSATLNRSRSNTLLFPEDAAARPSSNPALHDEIHPTWTTLQATRPEPHLQIPLDGHLGRPTITGDGAAHLPDTYAPLRKTVLLISADPVARRLVGHSLRQCDYEVLEANAGFTGYSMAMRERPDLVLLDLSLSFEATGPDACLDGRGVLKLLSKLPPDRALPFIGLVPKGASDSEAQILAAGAKACLQKPLEAPQLQGAIQTALDSLSLETDVSGRLPWTVSASV